MPRVRMLANLGTMDQHQYSLPPLERDKEYDLDEREAMIVTDVLKVGVPAGGRQAATAEGEPAPTLISEPENTPMAHTAGAGAAAGLGTNPETTSESGKEERRFGVGPGRKAAEQETDEPSPVKGENVPEAVDRIGRMTSVEKLQKIIDTDDRVTVVEAATNRKKDLEG